MTRVIAILITAALVSGLAAAPASAGGKRTVREEWQAVALPFPGADDHSNPDEECGEEGVTYTLHEFTTPGKGTLDVRIDQFHGEWDLYVTDGDGTLLGSSVQFMSAPDERLTLTLGAKVKIRIYACNFLGGPTAHAELRYTYNP